MELGLYKKWYNYVSSMRITKGVQKIKGNVVTRYCSPYIIACKIQFRVKL